MPIRFDWPIGGITDTVDLDGNLTGIATSPNPTSYVHDHANRLTTATMAGTTMSYVYGLRLAYTVSTNVTHTLQVLHTDGLGSVRAITDSGGILPQTFQTDEFGITVTIEGPHYRKAVDG